MVKNSSSESIYNDNAPAEEEKKNMFPVVAIGASSGGLHALNDLLENLPADLGMVYIVIQHLSPTHESILPELLSRKTKMEVHTVENGMHIKPDNVYVIPPNTYMSIVDSKLTLSERVKEKGVYHSIDFFLKALGPVYQAKAVAVILSGSGTDGMLGVQEIKAHGGITFAQDETAEFSGMPKAASDSGFTDFVLPCKRIAQEITAIVKNPQGILTMNELAEANEAALKKIHALLNNKKDVDFGFYKKTTVNRRILRRMTLNKFNNLTDYTKFLRENNHEIELLYKDLLINVTSFFRDAAVYDALSKKIFPALFKNRKNNDMIRIWTPACANGEEAYSLAICLFDYLKEKAISTPIQIFGTDLNEAAIDKARTAVYGKSVLEHVSPQRLERYFVKTDGHYQIIKPIRDVCIFAIHNLIKDPPFSRMDVISCQNVMIYLETNPQKKILQAFHYSIKPAGYLLLGKSESIGNSTELFTQTDKDLKIYSKKEVPQGNHLFDFSIKRSFNSLSDSNGTNAEQVADIDIEKETDKLLLSRYVPASVVINKDLQILHFHGDTSNYLQPSPGKASFHLLKMVKEELIIELKNLINRAKQEGMPVRKDGVHLSINNSEREISIEIVPIHSPVKDFYYLVLFREVIVLPATEGQALVNNNGKSKGSKDERISKLEQQLAEARDYMRTMSEEFEATREELQSSNEEVLSSNEELQSINEELETSKEELQSTNEELTTINDEMNQRNNELREANNYSTAIIETMNEPLLVLGSDMRIRTANKAFYDLFKTNIDNTEGQYFFNIENGFWNSSSLKSSLEEIAFKGERFKDIQLTKVFPGLGEKTFLFNAMRMDKEDKNKHRILLVVQDITTMYKAQQELKEREERFRLLLQNAFDIMTIYSKEGDIIYQSETLEKTLGYPVQDTLNKNIFQLGIVHADDVDLNKNLFEDALKNPGKNIKGQLRLQHKNGEYKVMDVVFRNLLNNENINGIVANYQDVTDNISNQTT